MTLAECPRADRRARMRTLAVKFEAVQAAKCTELPGFGFVSAADIATALAGEGAAALIAVFGGDPAATVIDATVKANKQKSVCQLTVQKFTDKIGLTMFKEFSSCVKREVAGRGDPIASIARLKYCLDVVKADAREKVAKAVAKLSFQITKRCLTPGIDLTQMGGSCVEGTDANAVAACLETEMACRACSMASRSASG